MLTISSPDAPQVIPDEDLAAIIDRAARLGIPAWRVATALGLGANAESPPPPRTPEDGSS